MDNMKSPTQYDRIQSLIADKRGDLLCYSQSQLSDDYLTTIKKHRHSDHDDDIEASMLNVPGYTLMKQLNLKQPGKFQVEGVSDLP